MKNLTLVMTRVFRTKVDMTNNAPMFIRVLLWLMLLPVYDPASADEPSARESSVRAAELLFDAAKAASEENGDISTIVADFELTINHPSVSPEDEEKEIQSRIERQEQDIQATSDEGLKRYLKESIKFIPDGVRQRNSRPQRMRGKYTLRLRPRPEMRKIKLAHFRNATEQWSEGVLGLSKVETGGIEPVLKHLDQ